MIVITGASGRLGGLVLDRLLELLPASEVGVSAREPQKLAAYAARGVRVRAGDYTDVASLTEAFEGARRVLVVSGGVLGEEGVRLHANAAEAARRAGAERVVYTAHQCASPDSLFVPGRDHAATEQALEASGVAWTSLRDGFHAATLDRWLAAAPDGVLRLPEDGPVSWTTHEDLAAAAAAVLVSDTPVDGPTPPLTGPEALDATAVAERATRVSGRAYHRELVGDAAYVDGVVEHGVPRAMAEMLLTMFLASRAGEFDVVDPYLSTLVGRPATSIDATLSAAAGSA
jgi:NAD(P)H dehydrogenase (quinone)